MEETCYNCGALYDIREIKLPVHDKDRVGCIYCGRILRSWDGRLMYCVKSLSGPRKGESSPSGPHFPDKG